MIVNAQLLHKICKYAYKNIHYKPWMTPIEVFKGGGRPLLAPHFFGLCHVIDDVM